MLLLSFESWSTSVMLMWYSSIVPCWNAFVPFSSRPWGFNIRHFPFVRCVFVAPALIMLQWECKCPVHKELVSLNLIMAIQSKRNQIVVSVGSEITEWWFKLLTIVEMAEMSHIKCTRHSRIILTFLSNPDNGRDCALFMWGIFCALLRELSL